MKGSALPEDVGYQRRRAEGLRPQVEPIDLGVGPLFWVIAEAAIAGDVTSGRIALWNPAAARLFGYEADEAVGMLIEDLIPNPLKNRHRAGMARFASTGETNLVGTGTAVELAAKHKDGTELWIEMTLSEVDAARLPGRFAIAVIRDVTEQRDQRAQLQAFADQVESSNRALHEFVAMAAHDLRSPLTAITGASGILGEVKGMPKEAEPLVAIVARQARLMAELIDDLADIAEIEGGAKAEATVVNVATAAGEAIESAGLQGCVKLDVAADLVVWANELHVRRIVANFLSNASKYAGDRITLSAREVATSVEIRVSDCGPGVLPEFVPRLFEKFARAGTSDSRPGSGLGLAIVAGLTQLNGGETGFEPHQPTGATFWVRLPASEP